MLRYVWVIDDVGYTRGRARTVSGASSGCSRSTGAAAPPGDTTGNSPGTKWTGLNAVAEHLDYGRRYTSRTNQVQRSFENTSLKQRTLDLIAAA